MTTEYRRTDRQVYRSIAGEHLLIDTRSKSPRPFRALTESAVPLWAALSEWRSEAELAAELRERFGIPEEQATADVHEFLEQLDTIGAIERQERH